MSVLIHMEAGSRRNSRLFLSTPKLRSNRSGFSVSLRVCWIHSQQSPDVHFARMGRGDVGAGNRTGMLDPTGKTGNRIDIQNDGLGVYSDRTTFNSGCARGSITYLTKVTCVLGCPYPSICCVDGHRKWDEFGLDSRSRNRWVAPAGKERHPLVGGTVRDGAA
jgi:hypothetical protein